MSYHSIVLGSLLHDIGKVIQKCENSIREEFSGSDEVCPRNEKGIISHLHSKYTDGFFNKYSEFKCFNEFNLNSIYNASWHHNPSDNSPLQWIITKADWYSSGIERRSNELNEEDQKYFEIPLISVISNVNIGKKFENYIYYKLGEFSADNILNLLSLQKVSLKREDYSNLFYKFFNEFKELDKNFYSLNPSEKSFLNYCKAIDALIYRYFWCVPSSVLDFPDISLYEHLKTTSAIAACLYKFHENDNSLNDVEKIKNDKIEKFLFVSGDVSGIQKYIFDIRKGKYSAKSLRARSFEIQVLCENVANYILSQFNLPIFNRIINAGGRFLLILPNVPEIGNELNILRREIEREFLEKYLGEITINISNPVTAQGEDFSLEKMPSLFAKIQKEIEIAKLKKFQTVLKTKEDFVISKYYDKFKSNQDLCPLCEKLPKEEDNELCQKCNLNVKIGTELPKTVYIKWPNSIFKLPQLYSAKEAGKFYDKFNEYEAGYGSYYSPYYVPIENDEILTFEEISNRGEGAKYLAMFKADVDNLGLIFTTGLGKNRSISRISMLSSLLNAFFTTYLCRFIENNYSNLYVIFSGGDDICIIGHWLDIIKFSLDFHSKFKIFTGNNPNITISAGIALFHHNIPVRNVAQWAEQMLEKSKAGNKNSITLFGTTVNWDEFKNAINSGEILDQWIKNKKISKGMSYKLLKYSKMKEELKKGYTFNALWRSYLYYDAGRNIGKKDKSFKEEFLNFAENLLNSNYAKISISYAIYKNREVSNE